ncbi:type II secretion system protein GspG [Lujinxingia vulgaris]|nr:type II secretion system protein GspG [Lujinxingia vulgaris]
MVRALAGVTSARGMVPVPTMMVVGFITAVFLGFAGVFVFGATCSRPPERDAYREIRQLRQLVNTFYLTSSPNRLPNELDELTQGAAPLTKNIFPDPWGNPYIYRIKGEREFEIFSAGRDGKAGTEDDVCADHLFCQDAQEQSQEMR